MNVDPPAPDAHTERRTEVDGVRFAVEPVRARSLAPLARRTLPIPVVVALASGALAYWWNDRTAWVLFVFSLAALGWGLYGAFIAPRMERRASPRELVVDARGVTWGDTRIPWSELVGVERVAYPHINRTGVECLELRRAGAAKVYAAAGASMEDLDAMIAEIRATRRRLLDEGPPDLEGLAQLDAVVGHQRVGED